MAIRSELDINFRQNRKLYTVEKTFGFAFITWKMNVCGQDWAVKIQGIPKIATLNTYVEYVT